MAFGDEWATFDDFTTSEPISNNDGGFLDTVYDWGADAVDSVVGASGTWLDNLLAFEFEKEKLSYKTQLEQQAVILQTVETEQQTGNVPLSPNYRQISTASDGIDNRLLMLGGALVLLLLIKR